MTQDNKPCKYKAPNKPTDKIRLIKVTHYEEYNSYDGHSLDKVAIDSLTNDREVKEWLSGMNKLAFLPQKRNIKT
jgi:hypothetical protein